jgi:hypothetical protein
MTKRLAVAGAMVAACIAAYPAGAATPELPAAATVQPVEIPVPADVRAAHPDGRAGTLQAVVASRPVTPNASEWVGCWRAYFTGDNSGWWGTEQENINPYWCGNGSAMRGVDASWHWQSCSWLVSCGGESGVGTWYGCGYGCGSVGQQIVGHFRVQVVTSLGVDITVLYQLYPNGTYWSYTYHN